MADTMPKWIKARRSYATGACVELAPTDEGFAMRNSRNPGVQISHTAAEFAAFVEAAKNGEFDHLVS
jgi:hypothetical protein